MDPEQRDPDRGVRPRNEKDEKGQEKQEEKGRGLDERYRRNPLGFVVFALLVIWLGVFLLLRNQGVFAVDDRSWGIYLWGGGALVLVAALLRVAIPRLRQPVMGGFVGAAIWIGVGFGLWFQNNWEIIGPIVLIAVGVAILAGRIAPRR